MPVVKIVFWAVTKANLCLFSRFLRLPLCEAVPFDRIYGRNGSVLRNMK
jgi:hypothetical protein